MARGRGGRVAMGVYKRGKVWWYRFTWRGEAIRESTKQTNRRVAEQIEAAHKTSLAKGEVGIRDRTPAATIRQFAKNDFLPFCRATFASKPKTLGYYENGTARLLEYPPGRRRIARHHHYRKDRRLRPPPARPGDEDRHRKSRAPSPATDVLARDGVGKGRASPTSCANDSWRSTPRSGPEPR